MGFTAVFSYAAPVECNFHLVKNVDLATELIERGTDVNARDSHGNTPLDFANTEEIKHLLRSHGAKPGKKLQEKDK